jgi:hypothetical protein
MIMHVYKEEMSCRIKNILLFKRALTSQWPVSLSACAIQTSIYGTSGLLGSSSELSKSVSEPLFHWPFNTKTQDSHTKWRKNQSVIGNLRKSPFESNGVWHAGVLAIKTSDADDWILRLQTNDNLVVERSFSNKDCDVYNVVLALKRWIVLIKNIHIVANSDSFLLIHNM